MQLMILVWQLDAVYATGTASCQLSFWEVTLATVTATARHCGTATAAVSLPRASHCQPLSATASLPATTSHCRSATASHCSTSTATLPLRNCHRQPLPATDTQPLTPSHCQPLPATATAPLPLPLPLPLPHCHCQPLPLASPPELKHIPGVPRKTQMGDRHNRPIPRKKTQKNIKNNTKNTK
jgi:hypothetical protein